MLFFWLLFSAFRAQPGRWLIAGLTVALGIALGVAIHTVNRSALGEFGRALDLVNGQASAQLVMPTGEFSDKIFDAIVTHQTSLNIRGVSPVLERSTQLLHPAKPLKVLGLDIFQAARVTPSLMPSVLPGQRQQLFSQDAIFLSAAALKELNISVGDSLTLSIRGKREIFKVEGLVPAVSGQALAVMDLGVAQWRLDGLDRISRLDIQLNQGQNVKDLAAKLEKLNLGLKLVTTDDRDRRMSNLSRAYRVNLSVLALVALFTGAFLVFTTISFSVLRQQSQLALLSVLGAKRLWLFAFVLTQALLVAAFGGLLGIGLGLALAFLLLRSAGGDLGAGYFSANVPPMDIDGAILVGFWVLSLAVGILAGYFPARAATAGQAVAQLRAGASERTLKPVLGYRVALSFGLISVVLVSLPAFNGLPIAAYLSIAFLLFAGLALTPSLVSKCFLFLNLFASRRRSKSSSLTFALWRLSQAPASAAGLIAGVVSALALTVAMVVMVASFRDSVSLWLNQVLPADLYASLSQSDFNQKLTQSSDLTNRISALPGINRLEFTLQQPLLFRADRPEVVLIARSVPVDQAAQVLPLTGGVIKASHLPLIFISEAMTDLYGWKPGEVQTLPILDEHGNHLSVWIAGVFRDYGRQHGSIVIDLSVYRALTKDLRSTDLAIWLLPEHSPSEVLTQLKKTFPQFEAVQFRSSSDLRALSLTIFDRSFALTYALEIAALMVALFSVAAGFAGQALLRQKEFALTHHLGQSASQLTHWLTAESGMLLAFAACWGTLLGLLMSQVLIHRVNPQSFHWTMQTSLPLVALVLLMLFIVLLGMLSAVWASKSYLNSDRLAVALREDW